MSATKFSLLLIVTVLLLAACGGAATIAVADTPAASSSESDGLAISCSLDDPKTQMTCQASGYTEGSQLYWWTNSEQAEAEGAKFDFAVTNPVPNLTVSLEECNSGSCQTVTTKLDTTKAATTVVIKPGQLLQIPKAPTISPDGSPKRPIQSEQETAAPTRPQQQQSKPREAPPPAGEPSSGPPVLTPQLEACLRGVLLPEAFDAIFETGSRRESAEEAPLVGGCFEDTGTRKSGGQQQPREKAPKTDAFDGQACTTPSDPQPKFTHEVISLDLISHTAPPGTAVSGMLKPHGYFFVKHDEETSDNQRWSAYPRSVAVSAPVESWLRSVHPYMDAAYGKEVGEPPIEYMLFFEVSCEVWYKLDHLGPLSDRIERLGPFEMGHNDLDQPLHIDAGEIVSYWSGVNPGGNVDIGVYNTTIEAAFANPDRYSDGYHDAQRYEDCPFDYFPDNLRSKYYAMMSDENTGQPVKVETCRTSAQQDLAGTISGKWFIKDKYESVVSIGTSLAGWARVSFAEHAEKGGEFVISAGPDQPTYIEPSQVTSEHCYQTTKRENMWYGGDMYANLKLLSITELEVEYGTGKCADRAPITTLRVER